MSGLKKIIIFVFILLISWSFLHIEPTHFLLSKRIENTVLNLKVLDGKLNQDFLKSQLHLSAINYDLLNYHLRDVRVQQNILSDAVQTVNHDKKFTNFEKTLEDYLNLAQRKEDLLEELKSENAVLSNSLHYLRTDYVNLQNMLESQQHEHDFELLQKNLVLFNLNPNNEQLKNEILLHIDHLVLEKESRTKQVQLDEIDRFLRHARIVLTNTAYLHSIITQLNQLDTAGALTAIQQENNILANYEAQVATAYRLLLGFIVFAMLAGIIAVVRRHDKDALLLKKSMHKLKQQQYALNQHAIVSVANRAGSIVYANEKFVEISGYSQEELLGKDHRLLNSGVHSREFFVEMWKTICSGKVWHSDICNRSKNGHLYWVQSTIVPFFDAKGLVQSFISMRTDITAQKMMEFAAIKSEEWQRTVLNNLGDGVYLLDLEGKLTYLNSTGERLFGYKFAELKGQYVHDLLHHHRADGTRVLPQECPVLINMQRQHVYQSDDELFFRKNGKSFPASVSSVPLFESGKLVGVVVCFRDITEQRAIQTQLIQAKEAAEKATRVKSDFLSTMSHEIRTPMNGIIGMTDLLLDTPLDAEQMEFATIIKSSSNALLSIINDVLDFSKIEAGQFEIESINFSFNEVIDGSTDVIAPRAHEKSLSLISYVDPKIPEHLLGDPTRLRQIVLNFLSNAVKFTSEGTVFARAILQKQMQSQVWVRVEVTDNGIGISQEAQKRLFQPFSQADSSTTRKYGGTGLGLSICKRLVELMHGRIGVESYEGQGATFWIELPFELADNTDDHLIDATRIKQKLMLVLGYQEGHHEVYVSYLNSWGVDVHSCENISDTQMLLEQVKDNIKPYDALLLAGLSVDELLKKLCLIRANEQFSQVPIIVCQASREANIRHELLKAGATQVLTTPVKQSTLFESLLEIFYHEIQAPSLTPQIVLNQIMSQEGQKYHLLLVEDNAVNQKIALRLLTKMGFDVDVADNGQEAFDIITTRFDYDLLLMDCQMPVMDGFTATRVIRHFELEHNRKRVPIVAMTANAMQGDRERCLEVGMDDYVSKPIDAQKLQQVLQLWLPDSTLKIEDEKIKTVNTKLKNKTPVELARMLDLFEGDEEIVAELLEVFYGTIETLKEKLQHTLENQSPDLKIVAHEIKGSSRNIGAEVLGNLAQELELAVPMQDWQKIAQLCDEILAELERVKQFIEERK